MSKMFSEEANAGRWRRETEERDRRRQEELQAAQHAESIAKARFFDQATAHIERLQAELREVRTDLQRMQEMLRVRDVQDEAAARAAVESRAARPIRWGATALILLVVVGVPVAAMNWQWISEHMSMPMSTVHSGSMHIGAMGRPGTDAPRSLASESSVAAPKADDGWRASLENTSGATAALAAVAPRHESSVASVIPHINQPRIATGPGVATQTFQFVFLREDPLKSGELLRPDPIWRTTLTGKAAVSSVASSIDATSTGSKRATPPAAPVASKSLEPASERVSSATHADAASPQAAPTSTGVSGKHTVAADSVASPSAALSTMAPITPTATATKPSVAAVSNATASSAAHLASPRLATDAKPAAAAALSEASRNPASASVTQKDVSSPALVDDVDGSIHI